jgi:hypothetical protein
MRDEFTPSDFDLSTKERVMNMPEATIRRWCVVGFAFSILYTLIGLLHIAASGYGRSPLPGLFAFLIAGLFWAGTILAANGKYSAARVLMMIGGALGLPLGLVMVFAGHKIQLAAEAMEQAECGAERSDQFTKLNLS